MARNSNPLLGQRELANNALSRPDQFPPAFLTWLRRFVSDNTLIHVSKGQGAGGGGTVSVPHIQVLWEGQNLPSTIGPNNIWVLPKLNAVSVNFGMVTLTATVVTPGTGTYTVKAQYSTNAGVTWADIASVSLAPGVVTNHTTFAAVALSSGTLVRINWTALGGGANIYTVQLEGDKQ